MSLAVTSIAGISDAVATATVRTTPVAPIAVDPSTWRSANPSVALVPTIHAAACTAAFAVTYITAALFTSPTSTTQSTAAAAGAQQPNRRTCHMPR